jgi:enamine deaminase RidA (YjgF/YER057c/UK114 family)
MARPLAPASIRRPFAKYSHGIEVPPGARLVFCSGQLGVAPDGSVPEDAGTQTELCFANVAAILAEAGMGLENIVRINAFVTGREHLKPYMEVRNRLMPTPPPASTLVIVSGFSLPEFKVEVEAIAAA